MQQPLDLLTEDQTLELMDMWIKCHKMDAAKKYNQLIVDKLASTFYDAEAAKRSTDRIFSAYKILCTYFNAI
jgi:hypothetical protein